MLSRKPRNTPVDTALVVFILLTIEIQQPLLFCFFQNHRQNHPVNGYHGNHKTIMTHETYADHEKPDPRVHGIPDAGIDPVSFELVL